MRPSAALSTLSIAVDPQAGGRRLVDRIRARDGGQRREPASLAGPRASNARGTRRAPVRPSAVGVGDPAADRVGDLQLPLAPYGGLRGDDDGCVPRPVAPRQSSSATHCVAAGFATLWPGCSVSWLTDCTLTTQGCPCACLTSAGRTSSRHRRRNPVNVRADGRLRKINWTTACLGRGSGRAHHSIPADPASGERRPRVSRVPRHPLQQPRPRLRIYGERGVPRFPWGGRRRREWHGRC